MLTYEQRQELLKLGPEELKERLIESLPEDLVFNIESVTNKYTVLKGICPNGHEYTRNVLDLIQSPKCSGCISDARVARREAILNGSWERIMAPFSFDPVAFRRDKPKKPIVLTCSAGHSHMTTLRDIMDESENLLNPYHCPVCVDIQTTNELLISFNAWMNDLNNGWMGCTITFDETTPPTEEMHEVTVTCKDGHVTTDTVYNFKRTANCPICEVLDKAVVLDEPTYVSPIRPETRQTEYYLAKQFEAKQPCSNGHIVTDGHCGICAGDEHLRAGALIPHLCTLTNDQYLFEVAGDYIDVNNTINVFCKDHGVFQRTPMEIANGIGCQYCIQNADEIKHSLYIHKDNQGGYYFNVTSIIDVRRLELERMHGVDLVLLTVVNGLKTGTLSFILELLRRALSDSGLIESPSPYEAIVSFEMFGLLDNRVDANVDLLIKNIKEALNTLYVASGYRYNDGVQITFPQILTEPCL